VEYIFTHADGSHIVRAISGYCAFVPLSVGFSTRYFKTDAARITKLDADMVHQESWKPIYFGVKRSKVRVIWYKKHAYISLSEGMQY